MTIAEIFSNMNTHEITGLMFHEQLANYFDFLCLNGYKRLHEYRYIEESCEMRGVNRYYINHFNKLIENPAPHNPDVIPANWFKYDRFSVDNGTKKNAVMVAFDKWVSWETETKKLYEQMYKEACDIDEIAAALKIKELICGVDMELKCATRMSLELKAVNYDLSYICFQQDSIHEEYRKKEEKIGIDIC